MILAVPSDNAAGIDSIRSGHFGHCAYFTLVDIQDGEIKSVESVPNVDHDAYGCGGVIEYAMSLGINAIIAAGMGVPPYTRFTQGGVEVYIDVENPEVKTVVERFIAGELPKMQLDQACAH